MNHTPEMNVSTMDEDFLFITWQKKFEIGIPEIDEQHKRLVELCNTFYLELMKHKKVGNLTWEVSLTNALKECVNYVKVHFSYEEDLIAKAGCPELEKQKALHAVFVKKILETSESFNTAKFKTALEFVKFLYDWILSHIAYEDKLYVPYVQKYLEGIK